VEAVPRGVWTLWADVPEPARGQLRAIYRDLRARYRPRGRLSRAAAKLVAELVFTTAAASEAGVLAVVKRQQGRGRRPNARQVNAALKRGALQLGSLNQALPGGVADLLAGKNGQPLDLARAIQQAQEAGR
jgi:hypothetical protein